MLSSESFLQPLYVDRSHMVEKAKSARNAEPGPLSLSAAVPLLGYAAELFGLTSPQKRQVSAASAPLPDDHELPPYGPPYNDDTVIASQAEKKGLSQEPWIPVTSGEQALLPPPPPPVFRNVPVASKDDWQKLKNQRPPLPLQGQTPEPEAIVGALIRDSVGPPLPAPPPPIIKKEKTNWKARQNAQLDAINNAIEDAEISSVVGAFEPQKLTQDPVFAKFAAENSREKTQHKRQPDNTGRNQFSNFPPRNIARPAPTPPPKHDIPLPPIPTHPPGADKPVSFQQFAVNGVEINFDNVHDKEAAANEKNKPVKDQRRGQKKRKFPNRVRLRRPQNGDNKPAARPVPDSLAAILEDEANKEEVQRPGRTLANLLTTLAPTRRPAPPIPTRAPLPHPAIHLPTQVPAPLPHLVEESHGLPPRIPPPLPIEPNPGKTPKPRKSKKFSYSLITNKPKFAKYRKHGNPIPAHHGKMAKATVIPWYVDSSYVVTTTRTATKHSPYSYSHSSFTKFTPTPAGHHFPAVEIGTAAPLDGPAHVAVPQPHVPLVPPHVNVGHPHRPGLHHNLEPITKAPLAHIQETTAHPSEVSTLPPRIIPPAYGHPTPPSYHHPTPSPYGHHRSTPTPSPYGHHLSTPTPAAHVHSTPTPHVPHFITTTHPPPSAYHHSTPTPHPPPPSPYPTTAIYTPKPLYGEKILEPFDLVDEVHHKAHFDHAHPHHPASRDESDDSPYRYKVVAVEGRQLPIRPFRHGFGYTTTPVPPYAPYHPHSLYTTTPPPAYSHNDLAPFGHSTPVVPYGAVAHTTEPPGYDGANKLSHPIQVTLKPRGDLGLKHPGIGGVPDPFFEGSSPVASYAVPPSGPAVPAASKPVAATAAPNFKHVSTLPPRIFPSPTFGPQNRESRAVGAAGGPTLKPFPAVPERTTKSYPYGKAAQEGASMLQPRIPAAGPTLRAKRRIDAGHRAISASRRRTSSSSSSRRRKLTPKEIREQVRKLPVRG